MENIDSPQGVELESKEYVVYMYIHVKVTNTIIITVAVVTVIQPSLTHFTPRG